MKPNAWACTASRLALVLGLSAGGAQGAHAAGFYLQEQSVKAIGRAFSGEVADTTVDTLWWNPAAIGGATHRSVYIGAAGILPGGSANDTGTLIIRPGQAPAPVGGDPHAGNPIKDGLLPSGAVAIPITDRLAVGVDVTAPFSFTTKYSTNSWARYTALTTSLRTIDIQPTVAYAATPWLRLGVGLNAEYSKANLSTALPNLLAVLPDGAQTLRGDGWDFGWSAGAQVHSDRITWGVSYKSSIKHSLNGSVVTTGLLGPLAANNGTLSALAQFNTPWQAIAGFRFKATDRLTVNVQGAYTGWSEFYAINLGAPINSALPEHYQDTWSIGAGADYAVNSKLTARGGVQFDETPVRNGERDARVPDGDRVNLALGASYMVVPAVTIDAAVGYTIIASNPINRITAAYAGTPAQTPILVSGETDDTNAVVLALGARFNF